MYLSYKTLQELIAKSKRVSPRELAELLTMSVMEVESVKSEAEKFDNMVVGLVTEVSGHPNADKLKLAKVDIGSKKVEIVCGGVNLVEGMKVAMALPGAMVRWHGEGEFAPLESAPIRGVKSNGMACAAAELGLSDSHALEYGIMDLSYLKAKPGVPLADALGKDDLVIEVDNKSITHRPDLWGHLGVARELAALWGTELKMPDLADLEIGNKGLKVAIKNSDLCSRYLSVVLSGIKIGPSPDWLKNKVEALGMRSINNIIDAANYVMLEIGQPLHTFDLQKLASPEIIVRRAKSGETIKTLDGEVRKLSTDMLVIADDKGPIALAGVMGGQSSEVSSDTTSLIVESATFDAINIRQTAMKLGLRSEASARFEKALDPNMAEIGIKRFVAVMQEINKSIKVESDLIDAYPKSPKAVVIEVSASWINERLGTQIKGSEIKSILESLGFNVIARSEATKQSQEIAAHLGKLGARNDNRDMWSVTVPSWRATRDVTIKEDLLEEVARIYGYGKIPFLLPKFDISPPIQDPNQDLRSKIRELLVGQGWTETLSYSFFRLGQNPEQAIEIENPVDQNKPYLRTSIYDTLHEQFKAARRAYEGRDIKLFEIGRVFRKEAGAFSRGGFGRIKLPNQPWYLGVAFLDYKDESKSLSKVWGIIKLLNDTLGINLKLLNKENSHKLPSGGAIVEVDLSGQTVSAHAIDPIPKYPSVVRDLSIIVPRGVTWAEIEKQVRSAGQLLKSVEVFDIYDAKGSIAFHLTFRAPDRTLTSEEVEEQVKKIKDILTKKFKVEVRDH
ncbi:TPA: phenylalanine--tRNA ligase subunit beta [Patescibacteria group bacterium]|nr:phenylalanine--tRNA ligase subunit beta [Patescibacteria group bacterium]